LFGEQDSEESSAFFDDQFVVETDDTIGAQDVLDEEVREELLTFKQWAQPDDVEFRIDKEELKLLIQKDLTDAGEIKVFHGFATRLYDRVCS
jgi:hypothetical protein